MKYYKGEARYPTLGLGALRPGVMYERTGEFRAPRKGEYYLSGAIATAYRALHDYAAYDKYHILREVPDRRKGERRRA